MLVTPPAAVVGGALAAVAFLGGAAALHGCCALFHRFGITRRLASAARGEALVAGRANRGLYFAFGQVAAGTLVVLGAAVGFIYGLRLRGGGT